MSKETICQILVNASNGVLPSRAFYTCGLMGQYEARLVGFAFADTTANTDNRLITIQSDSFRLPFGNRNQSFVFPNHTEHNHGNPQGEFPFIIEASGNGIDLTITSSTAYNNTANNVFQFCILSFIVKKLE